MAHKKELKAAFLPLKFLIPNRTNVHVQLCIDNRTVVAYINHLGGTMSLELNSIAVKMWAWCLERNMFLSALYVPGILNKIADLLSCLKLESTEWMLNPRIFKQIVNVYRMPVLDIFASTLNHQVPKYFSWTLDPQAVGMDAFSVNWNKGLLYMFPPFSLIQKFLRKIIEDKATVLSITPVWQSRPWYPMHATESPIRQASSITTQSTNIETAMVSNSTSSISEQEILYGRLAFVRRSFKDQKFSERVCKELQASWKPGTVKQYRSAWKQFFSWCSQRSCDPFSCSLNIISDYLVDLFYKGSEYRTINSHRSVISVTHFPADGICVGSYPFISRLMKGIFNLHPPCPRYVQTWDVSVVLRYLKFLSPAPLLSMENLTFKLVMLMVLVSLSGANLLHTVPGIRKVDSSIQAFLRNPSGIVCFRRLLGAGKLLLFREAPDLCWSN